MLSLEKEEDGQIRKNLLSVEDAGKRVGDQINDILDFSEIDMNKVAVNMEDFMISSMLNDVLSSIQTYMRPEVELVVDMDARLPLVMHSDATKLKAILKHLISNGLKFTEEGGVYVRLTMIEQEYGINLQIQVTDTGAGMDEETQERAFKRFYQRNTGRSRSVGGLGLGIPITMGFIRALNGFLTVDSIPGKGSTVRCSVPIEVIDPAPCLQVSDKDELCVCAFMDLRRYHMPEVREFYNRMMKGVARTVNFTVHRVTTMENLNTLSKNLKLTHLLVGQAEYEINRKALDEMALNTDVVVFADQDFQVQNRHLRVLKKPFTAIGIVGLLNTETVTGEPEEGKMYLPGVRALVVDDEPMNLTVASGIFERYGMDVTLAESGTEAVSLCGGKSFDIVFMDHMMPGMDGVEAMKRIRNEYLRKKMEVPIVALTANALSTAREMFLEEGFDGFVSKPIELIELERVMRKVLPNSMILYHDEEPDTTPKKKKEGEDRKAVLSALKEKGIDTERGLYFVQNDYDFYKKMLRQFVENAGKKQLRLSETFECADLPNYTVEIHSLKSSAKMLGADTLSHMAEDLEQAARNRNEEKIRRDMPVMMMEYDRLKHAIHELLGGGEADSPSLPAKGKPMEFSPVQKDYRVLEFVPPKGEEA